ncbi:glycoside hydrolase family 72 protein [Daldinia bambusicola]|nr:glycoside hydrolase family 72 protein [Daldinia bambusicola]
MSQSIVPITIQGRYFWRGIERFLLNGVAYHFHEPHSVSCSDTLVDDRLYELERILPLLKELKINTLFLTHIDGTKSHGACMNLLAEHGIYVLASIESICYPLSNPGASRPYTSKVMQRLFQAVEKLAHYPNLLGFVISTELIRYGTEEATEPFVRAAVRDVRRYLTLLAAKRHQRAVPVGVISPADSRPCLKDQYKYFCSGADDETAEFFTFSNFFWAGESTMQASGYSELVDVFSQTHIPVSFIYGNNSTRPRPFYETHATYSDPGMLRVFSGGIVHELFDGNTHFGLVKRSILPDDNAPRYRKIKDFRNLRERLKQSFRSIPTSMLVRSRVVEAAAMSGTKPNPPHPGWSKKPVGHVPLSPVNWAQVETQLADDTEWVDAGKEWAEITVEDLADSMWDRLNIDGIDP